MPNIIELRKALLLLNHSLLESLENYKYIVYIKRNTSLESYIDVIPNCCSRVNIEYLEMNSKKALLILTESLEPLGA